MPRSCSVISSMPAGPMISSGGSRLGQLDLDLLVVELPLAQPLAERLARGVVGRRATAQAESARARRRQQHVEDALLGGVLGAHAHLGALASRASA